MSDFFTHLVGQVMQPAADVLPAIPVHFAPGADLHPGELAPEPPPLDALFQATPAVPSQPGDVGPSPLTRSDPQAAPERPAEGAPVPAPARPESKLLPAPPGAEAIVRGPGAEIEIPDPAREAAPPGVSSGAASPTPPAGKDGPAVLPARPSVTLSVAGEDIPAKEPLPEGETPGFAPEIRPVRGPEPRLKRPSSAVPGTPPFEPMGDENEKVSISRPAAPAVKPPTAAVQPQLPPAIPRAESNFPPDMLPPLKPPAAETHLPQTGHNSLFVSSASPVERHPETETAAPPSNPARLEAGKKLPASGRVEPELVRAVLPAAENPGGLQPNPDPRSERTSPQPTELPTIPGPAPAVSRPATLPSVIGERQPTTKQARPASKVEGTEAQSPYPAVSDPSDAIRPVLRAEPPLEKKAPAGRVGSDEPALPSLRLTIGRIVVKAAPPVAPAVPRPASARRQPAVSLMDYLNRHGGSK